MQKGDPLPVVEKHVTQERIEKYAAASGDFNPIHVNKEFAEASQFGSTIAHGMMILAFVSEMLTKAFGENWLNTGKMKIRFRNPVYPGDVVSTFGEIKKVQEIDGVRRVNCSIGAKNQKGETAITGDASVEFSVS